MVSTRLSGVTERGLCDRFYVDEGTLCPIKGWREILRDDRSRAERPPCRFGWTRSVLVTGAGSGARNVTAHERACRNAEVIRARARGFSWDEIARRSGLSDRQCRRILADYRQSRPGLHEIDPVEVIEEALDAYDAAIEDLALLAEQTSHDGTRLGAIRSRVEASRAKMELMHAVGVLPSLHVMRVEVDAHRLAQTVLEVFRAHRVSHEAQKAVLEALEGRSNGSAPYYHGGDHLAPAP